MTDFSVIETRVTEACYRRLSNARASIDGGEPFAVIFGVSDEEAFGATKVSTHTMRYSVGIDVYGLVAIDAGVYAGSYKVVGIPSRINGSECLAELVKQ